VTGDPGHEQRTDHRADGHRSCRWTIPISRDLRSYLRIKWHVSDQNDANQALSGLAPPLTGTIDVDTTRIRMVSRLS
jgi:hypothetical protein